MKERPILFSAPMVRALLNGTKTQTRRVVADQWRYHLDEAGEREQLLQHCRYGQPCDRLWVRETHAPQADCWGSWERWLHGAGGPPPIIHYAADFEPFQDGQGLMVRKPFIEKWRPSIHMPRWASRIDLDVTGVRIERLQDISEADAIAEGVEPLTDLGAAFRPAASAYSDLWEQINGVGSWTANPWVWAISFRRITP